MLRFLCLVLYYGFARHLPPSTWPGGAIYKSVRYAICRHLFASCGKDVNVESGAFFHSGRQISIGDHSGIGIKAELNGPVQIGRDVMMGPNVKIYTQNHRFDRTDIPMRLQGFTPPAKVQIDNDVWIGSTVLILPGVHIQSGCVIAAGSVVTKSTDPYQVIAGNPARAVKERDSQAREAIGQQE